jgi:hypothetical protein
VAIRQPPDGDTAWGSDIRATIAAVNALTEIPQRSATGNYTLTLADAGKAVELDSATAATLTVPANGTVAFPVGTVIEVLRLGTGTLALAPAAGVTLRTPSSLTLRAQYSSAILRKRAGDEWVVAGDLT